MNRTPEEIIEALRAAMGPEASREDAEAVYQFWGHEECLRLIERPDSKFFQAAVEIAITELRPTVDSLLAEILSDVVAIDLWEGDRLAMEAHSYQLLVSAQRLHDLLKSKEGHSAV
jgi:hypothetical protein